jgi:hypothetical protein
MPTLLVAHLYFFPTHKAKQKNPKELPSQRTNDSQMSGQKATEKEQRRHNSGLAKKRVSCFYDTFVVKQTFVLLINFSANNPLLRQATRR